jgi:hypothetical protein
LRAVEQKLGDLSSENKSGTEAFACNSSYYEAEAEGLLSKVGPGQTQDSILNMRRGQGGVKRTGRDDRLGFNTYTHGNNTRKLPV